ncbi:hypothetical protein SmJEL517_g03093 [Synchytrium microbalum]|uniref:Trafficking protein particle complex subunit n=1 Tax=Synchytrium microbalum TaxID=1806994 RepID=A0A507C3C3_9FUNG|nr:uncharacterized protein SmJEL517_g03093 [Synchytrium microbalum]TPX34162.1 hypothetical protein SmJEL517_g03093 [Synchytrium microbalum]
MAGNRQVLFKSTAVILDNPVYEAEFGPQTRADTAKKEDHRHLNQFIVHAALDIVEDSMWGTSSMYLKVIDKYNEWLVSAYVSASGVKFMLLHDTPNVDGIRNFFVESHEMFVKILMNPFYELNAPITSPSFDTKVRASARKYL